MPKISTILNIYLQIETQEAPANFATQHNANDDDRDTSHNPDNETDLHSPVEEHSIVDLEIQGITRKHEDVNNTSTNPHSTNQEEERNFGQSTLSDQLTSTADASPSRANERKVEVDSVQEEKFSL